MGIMKGFNEPPATPALIVDTETGKRYVLASQSGLDESTLLAEVPAYAYLDGALCIELDALIGWYRSQYHFERAQGHTAAQIELKVWIRTLERLVRVKL